MKYLLVSLRTIQHCVLSLVAIVAVIGCGQSIASDVARIIPKMEDGQEFHRLLDLAELGVEGVPAICSEFESSSGSVKVQLASLLGEYDRPQVLMTLLGALDDGDPEVRRLAAQGLAGMSFDRVRDPLMKLAQRVESIGRGEAITALGSFSDPSTLEFFLEATRDSDPRIRDIAVWALRSYDADKVQSRIAELMSDPDPEVRGTAFIALARSAPDDPRVQTTIRTLEKMIASSEPPEGLNLVRLLGESRSSHAAPFLYGLLRDPSVDIQLAALGALRDIRDFPVREEALLSAIQSAEDRVRYEALSFAGKRRVASVVPIVAPLLTSSSDPTRVAAAQCLNRIGSKEAATALKPLLFEDDLMMRAIAAGALELVGDPDTRIQPVLRELDRMAHSGKPRDRLLAADFLGFFSNGKGLALANELSEDRNVLVASHMKDRLLESEAINQAR